MHTNHNRNIEGEGLNSSSGSEEGLSDYTLTETYRMSRDFPGGASGKELACQCRRHKRCGFDPWVRKIPWRRAWQPAPVLLPRESHGQRSLVGYSP